MGNVVISLPLSSFPVLLWAEACKWIGLPAFLDYAVGFFLKIDQKDIFFRIKLPELKFFIKYEIKTLFFY